MNDDQKRVHHHLSLRPPLTEEGERCRCCRQHSAYWNGVDNPSANVTDFYEAGSTLSGAFQAGQDFMRRNLATKRFQKTQRKAGINC